MVVVLVLGVLMALDVPGVYAGSGTPRTALLPTCSGDVIGGYATTETRFPGW